MTSSSLSNTSHTTALQRLPTHFLPSPPPHEVPPTSAMHSARREGWYRQRETKALYPTSWSHPNGRVEKEREEREENTSKMRECRGEEEVGGRGEEGRSCPLSRSHSEPRRRRISRLRVRVRAASRESSLD